jgi:ribosomal protein S18 acetylase RimI-like enzyme
MDYVIRPAMPADAPGIAKVARHTWYVIYAQSIAAHNRQRFLDRAYDLDALREAIRREPRWFYVAIQTKTLVGFAHYLRRFDEQGELVRMYVHPDHQRRGIGRVFLATGLAALAEAGVGQCYVSVETDNTGACAFYERFGFRPHREHGRFLGDQIIRLVEYAAPVANLLDATRYPTTKRGRTVR